MEEQKITQTISSIPNVKLKQTAKGKYYWEISISRENIKEVLKEICEVDEFLKNKFKGVKK